MYVILILQQWEKFHAMARPRYPVRTTYVSELPDLLVATDRNTEAQQVRPAYGRKHFRD